MLTPLRASWLLHAWIRVTTDPWPSPACVPILDSRRCCGKNKDKIPALQLEILRQNKYKIPALQIEETVKRANQSKWCLLIDTTLYLEPGDEFSHQQRQGIPEESYCS